MTPRYINFPTIKFFKACLKMAVLAVLFSYISCSDDFNYKYDNYDSEGEPATLSLNISTPGMAKLTRAEEYDDYQRITSLWIGIYNANSKVCTYKGLMTKDENGFSEGSGHINHSLRNIPTKSGSSYIVAVANPENYEGMFSDNQTIEQLDILLSKAESWDIYKSIIITGLKHTDGSIDIQTPETTGNSGLLMSGIYDDASTPGNASHPVSSETPIYITEGNNTLQGAIHLRLLQSHIKFNLQGIGDIIEITPQSYQVHHVPFTTWLHEHTDKNDIENSGDVLLNNKYDSNQNKNYFNSSLLFTSTSFIKDEQEVTDTEGNKFTRTKYSFDFWQMENKREGLETCDEYADREREYGAAQSTDMEIQQNTGIFMSLTSSFENPTLNNLATYVDIPCIVKYRNKTTSDNSKPGIIVDNDNIFEEGAERTANITYRIHLGYVNKVNDAEKSADPKDFNCYRNSDYTYNITVTNLHNVIVEAFRAGDPQPGAFGDVTDVTDTFFKLDAHYGVFNIYLSDEDLKAFSYRIISYENNSATEIKGEKDNKAKISQNNWKFYNWISLKYTGKKDKDSSEQKETLEPFPGSDTYQEYISRSAKLLYLDDFIPNSDGSSNRENGWYTVYINEYTYENGEDETRGNWKKYVNQPDRMFWINVAQKISTDGESVFYKAKYAGSQRSIQTYYDTGQESSSTAIGVEHENENFGMNLRWTIGTEGLNSNNGRVNVWNNVGKGNGKWDDYITRSKWQRVNPINNETVTEKLPSRFTNDQIKGGLRSVPMTNLLTISSGQSMGTTKDPYLYSSYCTATDYDPQTTHESAQYIQTMYACMNRNRDENGDGTIDASELKWYLPASGKYLRVILGRNSLVSPIMSYINNENLPYSEKPKDAVFMYLSSDNKVVWTVEGISSSSFHNANPYCAPPWQVRCIRNLGTNLSDPTEDKVDPAYEGKTNGTSAIVKVKHYYGSSLRNPRTEPLPLHKSNSEYNTLSRYGFEVAYIGNNISEPSSVGWYPQRESEIPDLARNNNTNYLNFLENNLKDNNGNYTGCQSLNEKSTKKGWRVPNQKELTIMLRLEILKSEGDAEFFTSCTTEYWDDQGLSLTDLNLDKYRLSAARMWDKCMTQDYYKQMRRIRCVRDLQPGEYPDL